MLVLFSKTAITQQTCDTCDCDTWSVSQSKTPDSQKCWNFCIQGRTNECRPAPCEQWYRSGHTGSTASHKIFQMSTRKFHSLSSRLQATVPPHKVLQYHVNLVFGWLPSSEQRHHPGQPRCRWIDQVWKDETSRPLEKCHPTWSLRSDATTLTDYMLRTTSFVVKTIKSEPKTSETRIQYLDSASVDSWSNPLMTRLFLWRQLPMTTPVQLSRRCTRLVSVPFHEADSILSVQTTHHVLLTTANYTNKTTVMKQKKSCSNFHK